MTITPLALLTIAYGLLIVISEANASFRAVPAESAQRRRNQVIEFPFAFLVSYIREDVNWCITATNGVENGRDLGIASCDFDRASNDQLFSLDENGMMIHSKANYNLCFVIEGDDIRDGQSKLQFGSCNRRLTFNTFLIDRDEMSMLRLAQSPSHCIKQNGNAPQVTDALRTFVCDDVTDLGIYFDYEERACSTRLEGVECCEDRDCDSGATCQDYSCGITSCDLNSPDVECCEDSDCFRGETCGLGNRCFRVAAPNPLPICNTNEFGVECCSNSACPFGFSCESNVCVTPALYLISNFENNADLCASTESMDEAVGDVVFRPCRFRFRTGSQLWHRDIAGRFRSNLDLTRCMTVAPGIDTYDGVGIHLASCMINQFNVIETDQIRLGEDESYCLSSFGEGRMTGRPCENDNPVFEFDLQQV